MRLFLTLVAASTLAEAGIISTGGQNPGTTVNAIDITGFTTTGNQMAGMTVTGTFTDGITATCIWADGGGTTGNCAATNGGGSFSLTLTGDTFSNPFNLGVTGTLNLLSLLFNGIPGGTVFDRTFTDVGTPGSELGLDANGTTVPAAINGSATYIDQVGTLGNAPVGDLFARLQLDFSGAGLAPLAGGAPVATFSFDTDTIGVRGSNGGGVPEPSTWAMMAGGLALVAFSRLRRS